MENFAAINFETANGKLTSVYSIGVVIVRGGKIVDKNDSSGSQLLYSVDDKNPWIDI